MLEVNESEKETLEEENEEETITLTKSQYDAVITRLEELDTRLAQEDSQEDDRDIDDLAEEGRKALNANATPQQRKDIEEMSNTEIVNYILNQVVQYSQPVVSSIETLKAQREIDKCEAKYDDFWDYQKAIQKIAVANPTLSIEQAYKLAKQENPKKEKEKMEEKSEDEIGDKRSTSAKILNLPKLKPLGEKSGMSAGAASKGGVMTLHEAAVKAARDAGLE